MLTEKQGALLAFIERFIVERGASPTYQEMAEHLDLKSKSGIHRMVGSLMDRGFIAKTTDKRGAGRSIEVVKPQTCLNAAYERGFRDGFAASKKA
jgi:repressor LexA